MVHKTVLHKGYPLLIIFRIAYIFPPSTTDRPLAANYPSVLRQYSLLTCFVTMRASVWSAPIQNRNNRSQGTIHTSCTIQFPSTTLHQSSIESARGNHPQTTTATSLHARRPHQNLCYTLMSWCQKSAR